MGAAWMPYSPKEKKTDGGVNDSRVQVLIE
jgi:hypothetical protein